MSSEVENIAELLEELSQETQSIPFSRLYALSDLAGAQLVAFRRAWDRLPPEGRRRLARALVDLAEASFQVNFDAIFRHGLQDPDPVVRATAVDGLWEDQSTDLIGPFLAMLRNDPAAPVRAAAAIALGRYVLAGQLEEIEAPVQARIVAELLSASVLAGERVEVRRRAIESASYACTPEVQDLIEMAYYDEDEAMRISAVVSMGRSCDRRWQPVILRELESESAAMRYEAAWASGELQLRPAVPLLADLIDDADRQVGTATIWALGQIGGEQAKALLLDAHDDADPEAQAAIEDALAEMALLEGDLDLLISDLGQEDEWPQDEFISLWEADDEDAAW